MNSFFDTPASKINIKDSFNPEFPNTWKETVGSTYGQYGGQKFNTKVFDGDQGWNTGNGTDNWGRAVSKAVQYLSGTGKNKYTQRGQQSGTYFGGQQQGTYFGGPGGIQIADDITVVPGTSTPGFTVQAPQQKSSGLGGAIGTVAGAIGGSFIPGVGTGLGAGLGGTIGGLFD